MEKRFLIVDKKQRVEIEGQYPYAVSRIMEELTSIGTPYIFAYSDEITLELVSGKLDIFVAGQNILDFTHILLRGHFSRRDYEIKQIIVAHIEKHNSENPDKQIFVQNAGFIKKLPHYTKPYQMLVCTQNNIPYLDTYYQTAGNYVESTGFIKYPKILKHYSGKNYYEKNADGKLVVKKNVFLVNEAQDYNSSPLSKRDLNNFFVQEFAPAGEDIRIFMQRDKIIGGWKRKAKNDNFLTVAKGSVYEMYNEPSAEIADVCIRTAKAFSSDFMAIDLIINNEKPYVLEVNMNPGFKAYETKIEGAHANIARAIIESL